MTVPDDLTSSPLYQFCKTLCESLDNKTLETIVTDRGKTLEVAKSNVGPDKIDDLQYIESVVHEMQELAVTILENRKEEKN